MLRQTLAFEFGVGFRKEPDMADCFPADIRSTMTFYNTFKDGDGRGGGAPSYFLDGSGASNNLEAAASVYKSSMADGTGTGFLLGEGTDCPEWEAYTLFGMDL